MIGAIVAADSDQGGVGLAVGGITGAGLFVAGVVSAVIILVSKEEISVNRRVFFRDTGFYILAISILCISSYWGSINLFFSLMFVAIYATFIIFVALEDIRQRKQKKLANEENLLNSSQDPTI